MYSSVLLIPSPSGSAFAPEICGSARSCARNLLFFHVVKGEFTAMVAALESTLPAGLVMRTQ